MKRYPLVEEIRTPFSAAEFFRLFHQEPFAFFLDSGMDPAKLGRYSFIGWDPFLVLKSRGDELTLLSAGREERRKGNPFRVLGELLERYDLDPGGAPTPLAGGAVGYFSYDLCHFIENVPGRASRRPPASGVLSGLLRRGHHLRSPGAEDLHRLQRLPRTG